MQMELATDLPWARAIDEIPFENGEGVEDPPGVHTLVGHISLQNLGSGG